MRRGDWSSPAFFVEGIVVLATVGAVGGRRGAAVGDGLGVAAFGAGGVLASVGPTSMMKRTIRAGGVLLGASGMGVSESITIGALGVAVSLGRFRDLEPLVEEEEGGEEDGKVVGVNGDDHRSGLLGEPNSSALVKVAGRANLDRVPVEDRGFVESDLLFVVVWEDVGRD